MNYVNITKRPMKNVTVGTSTFRVYICEHYSEAETLVMELHRELQDMKKQLKKNKEQL